MRADVQDHTRSVTLLASTEMHRTLQKLCRTETVAVVCQRLVTAASAGTRLATDRQRAETDRRLERSGPHRAVKALYREPVWHRTQRASLTDSELFKPFHSSRQVKRLVSC